MFLTKLAPDLLGSGGACSPLLRRRYDALADLLQLLADDYGAWSAGLPDLLLWRAPEKGARQARLCEVKSPNDSLSAQQRAWCAALRSAGCDVEMAQVLPPPKRPAAGGFSAWKPNNRRSNKRR